MNAMQTSLFDQPRAHVLSPEARAQIEKETEAAIKKGWQNAKVSWRRMVLELIYETALRMPVFSQNDFRDELKKREKERGLYTHDNRAVAGATMTAKCFGWILPTGEKVTSVVGHKTRIELWQSKIYGKR